MEWQKRKGPWSWDQNACGKWVTGNCLAGACIPQVRNEKFCPPLPFSRILLKLDLGLSVVLPLLFPLHTPLQSSL